MHSASRPAGSTRVGTGANTLFDVEAEALLLLSSSAYWSAWHERLDLLPSGQLQESDLAQAREVFKNLRGIRRVSDARAEVRIREAAQLCSVALEALWRRTSADYGRRRSPSLDRSLLNLRYSEFAEYFSLTHRLPEAPQGFNQGALRKFWNDEIPFHEDVIRYLFQPKFVSAPVRKWVEQDSTKFATMEVTYGRAVQMSTYDLFVRLCRDPVYRLYISVRASLPADATVTANAPSVDHSLREAVRDGFNNVAMEFNVYGPGHETKEYFISAVIRLLDGCLIAWSSGSDREAITAEVKGNAFFLAQGLNAMTHPVF